MKNKPSNAEWIIIEVADDQHRLRMDGEKLRKSYPDKYDIRITPNELDERFSLAVRHVDPEAV